MGRVKPQNIRIVLAIRSPAQSSACRVAERSPLPDLRDKDYEITSRDGPTPRGISILPVIESNLSSWGTDFNRRTQRAQSPIRRPPNYFNASSFAFFRASVKQIQPLWVAGSTHLDGRSGPPVLAPRKGSSSNSMRSTCSSTTMRST